MAADFQFEQQIAFQPDNAAAILRNIPALPGVFALRGSRESDEPYLTRAADLRRRITRILAPPEHSADGMAAQSKRLNLRDRVARIEYTITGSEFESTLALYHAASSIFGLEQARRRLKLRTPYFLRFTAENAYPRVYSTNRLSKRALEHLYGPFPSRAAADRYCDAVLDLFKLRRCYEDLMPAPEHPGCIYQEMKKCLAPCNQAHRPEGAAAYSAEAEAVKRFFDTHGESMIVDIGLQREEASAAMEFEKAAALHTQWHKVKAAQALADELVRPIPNLRAIVVQRSTAAVVTSSLPPSPSTAPLVSSRDAVEGSAPPDPTAESSEPWAAVFLLHAGCIAGPELLSTLGVRAVKEQTSVGSSLFAQPLMLQAIPLQEPIAAQPIIPAEAYSAQPQHQEETPPADFTPLDPTPEPAQVNPMLSPEIRAEGVIATLGEKASAATDVATLSDHLSLLRRWYYRPEKQRAGEIFFPREDHSWPIRRILRGAARLALGEPKPMAGTHRELVQRNPEDEAQKPARTKILHEGRPDVEREVTLVERKFRSRKRAAPSNSES